MFWDYTRRIGRISNRGVIQKTMNENKKSSRRERKRHRKGSSDDGYYD